jgi:hypothetical protein
MITKHCLSNFIISLLYNHFNLLAHFLEYSHVSCRDLEAAIVLWDFYNGAKNASTSVNVHNRGDRCRDVFEVYLHWILDCLTEFDYTRSHSIACSLFDLRNFLHEGGQKNREQIDFSFSMNILRLNWTFLSSWRSLIFYESSFSVIRTLSLRSLGAMKSLTF